MVNLNSVYQAVKSVYDGDATLGQLLTQSLDSSKVFIGLEMPKGYMPPAIQIVGVTDTLHDPHYWSDILFRTNAYARASMQGISPDEDLAAILERVFTLTNEVTLTVASHKVFIVKAESRDASAVMDRTHDTQVPIYFQGITWRLLAVKRQ